MRTPWGRSQGRGHQIRRGITYYETAGHGGARVTRQALWRLGISKACQDACTMATRDGLWYEQDCDLAVLMWELGDIDPAQIEHYRQIIRAYNTDYYNAKLNSALDSRAAIV